MIICVVPGCEIIGVEIMEGAKLIESHPFKGPTAFILGNEVTLPTVSSR